MNLETVHDLADLLPPQGKHHYLQLRDAAADASAVTHGFALRLVEENQRRQSVSLRLTQIRAQRVDAEHPEMITQTRALADADAEIARINERVTAHNLIAAPRATLLRKVEDWLRSTAANHDFADIEPEPVKLQKGEQIPAGIDRHRRRLRELDADAHRINSAPYPSAHAKIVAANYINTLADAATPIVSSLVEHGGPLMIDGKQVEDAIVWPSKLAKFNVDTIATVSLAGVPAPVAGKGIATGEQVDVLGLMAFLFRDQMLARIGELVDAESDDKAALSPTQRAEQLATIAADRQAVELDEARLLWAGFGTTEPRPDMTPAAFLMVMPITKAERPVRDHADAVATARRARSASQPAGPGDISIPGLT